MYVCVYDDQVVIRKTLTDFKRTHQDEWDYRHKLRFTSVSLFSNFVLKGMDPAAVTDECMCLSIYLYIG